MESVSGDHTKDRYNPHYGDRRHYYVTQAIIHQESLGENDIRGKDTGRSVPYEQDVEQDKISRRASRQNDFHSKTDRDIRVEKETLDSTGNNQGLIVKGKLPRDDLWGKPPNYQEAQQMLLYGNGKSQKLVKQQPESVEPCGYDTLSEITEVAEEEIVPKRAVRCTHANEVQLTEFLEITPKNSQNSGLYEPLQPPGKQPDVSDAGYYETPHDGLLSLIDVRPKRIHLLPSAESKRFSREANVRPLHFEYSVFSPSVSPSESRCSSPLTLYSESSSSFESEFFGDLTDKKRPDSTLKLQKEDKINWELKSNQGKELEAEVALEKCIILNEKPAEEQEEVTSDVLSERAVQKSHKEIEKTEITREQYSEEKNLEFQHECGVERPSPHQSKGLNAAANETNVDQIQGNIDHPKSTVSGLTSLPVSPIHTSHQGMQTEGFRWDFDKGLRMTDAYLQTECEISTQTESEVATQTDQPLRNHVPFIDPVFLQQSRLSPSDFNRSYDNPCVQSINYLTPSAQFRDPGSIESGHYIVTPDGYRHYSSVHSRDPSPGHDKSVGTGSLDNGSALVISSPLPGPKPMTSMQQQTDEAVKHTMHCQTEDAPRSAVHSQTEQIDKHVAQSQTESADKVAAHCQTDTAGKITVQSQTSVTDVTMSDKGCQIVIHTVENNDATNHGRNHKRKSRSSKRHAAPEYRRMRSYSTSGSESFRCLPPEPRYPDEYARRPQHRRSKHTPGRHRYSNRNPRELYKSDQPLKNPMYDPWGRPYTVTSLKKMGVNKNDSSKGSDDERYFSSGSSNTSTSSGRRLLPPEPDHPLLLACTKGKYKKLKKTKARKSAKHNEKNLKYSDNKSTKSCLQYDRGNGPRTSKSMHLPDFLIAKKSSKWLYVEFSNESDGSSPMPEHEKEKTVKVLKEEMSEEASKSLDNVRKSGNDHDQIQNSPVNVFHHYTVSCSPQNNQMLNVQNQDGARYVVQASHSINNPTRNQSPLNLLPSNLFLPRERSDILNTAGLSSKQTSRQEPDIPGTQISKNEFEPNKSTTPKAQYMTSVSPAQDSRTGSKLSSSSSLLTKDIPVGDNDPGIQKRKVLPPTPLHLHSFASKSGKRIISQSTVDKNSPVSSITNRSGTKYDVSFKTKPLFEAGLKASERIQSSSSPSSKFKKDEEERLREDPKITPYQSSSLLQKPDNVTPGYKAKSAASVPLPIYSFSGITGIYKTQISPQISSLKPANTLEVKPASSFRDIPKDGQNPSKFANPYAKDRPWKMPPTVVEVPIEKPLMKQPEILVPGKRVVSSYLNDEGQKVVILAPGIGNNAPLGKSPQKKNKGIDKQEMPQAPEANVQILPRSLLGGPASKDCSDQVGGNYVL